MVLSNIGNGSDPGLNHQETLAAAWRRDRVDVRGILFDRFALERDGSLPDHLVAPAMVERHFWALYRRSK
jgi:hypothetical protein